ncbi:MAG: YfhO family protein, partial [Paraprevotella sp.]|nr:YfhO family protein [Paraprevotella sp.]
YYQRTGKRTRWTNALFSGMPTYQMAPSYDSTDTLVGLQRVYQLGMTGVVMYVFVMLLGFYILLRAFNFKVWMAALGAILWAFSSYFFIIIGAGHIWKVMTLAYIPPTIAGLVLCYRGKYLWGGVVTAFFFALQILSNHVQMSYYFFPVMGLIALSYLIQAVREKKLGSWCKATGVLIIAALLGLAINLSNLYHTYQYSKESIRSKSELTYKNKQNPENQTKNGLERDYITQWSYGIDETWTLLVPNIKGGASLPLTDSQTAMEKANTQYTPVYQALTQYWGEQPGTSGPVYVGVFVLMLFILSLFIVKGPMKWCLFILTVLSIMLSWGRNFMGLTDFFLDYVPMYDKFRTVASILVVAEFTIPLLAMMSLKELIDHPDILKTKMKYVYISFALTGGFAFLFALMPDVFFGNYISSSETSMLQDAVGKGYIPQNMFGPILSNLHEMRKAVVTADAWRSFFIAAVGLLLSLAYTYKKIKGGMLVSCALVLCLFDLWQVDKRYLNDGMFSEPLPTTNTIAKTQTDEIILKDPDKDYRVMNLTGSPFNENRTSYYHKSIGGYHAAKLRRYQEMIEEHIAPEMSLFAKAVAQTEGDLSKVNGDTIFPILNMLNVKYAIMGQEGKQTFPIYNPYADGNGWFVKGVRYVPDADGEILGLHHINPKETALVNERFKMQLQDKGTDTPSTADTTGTVKLTHYDANALTYEVNSAKGGVVVFSEVYDPGWQAQVDGQPVNIVCADYILRAIRVTPGKHIVTFSFDPKSLHLTEAIANISLTLLMLVFLFLIGREVVRRRKEKQPAA